MSGGMITADVIDRVRMIDAMIAGRFRSQTVSAKALGWNAPNGPIIATITRFAIASRLKKGLLKLSIRISLIFIGVGSSAMVVTHRDKEIVPAN